MTSSNVAQSNNGLHRYSKPSLVVYGSVRDLTGGASGAASDGSDVTNPTKPTGQGSDRSYKENIVQIGQHHAGFGLYLFDYKSCLQDDLGHGRKFGVMADEVEQVMPDAVFVDSDGYRKVNYSLLGISIH